MSGRKGGGGSVWAVAAYSKMERRMHPVVKEVHSSPPQKKKTDYHGGFI